jgi:integrase
MGRRGGGTLPQVRRHEGTGQGRVRFNDRTFYVGRYGSPEAAARYIELMIEHGFVAAPSTVAPVTPTPEPAQPEPPASQPANLPRGDEPVPAGLTVGEVCRMHLLDIEANVPGGQRSGKYTKALAATRAVRPLATMPAAEFGTRAMIDVRRRLINTPVTNRKADEKGNLPTLCRRYINEVMGHVRRMFEWAGAQELIPGERAATLKLVKPLREGETNAREGKRRTSVRPSVVKATLPYMTQEVADLIWFIRLTGCRPSEAARMRLCRLFDREKPVWRYVPKKHKTAHKGKSRHVPVGPQAQAILLSHTAGRSDRDYVFTPKRSVPARKAKDGVIPMEQRCPTAHAGEWFTKDGIRQAVIRAIRKANKARACQGLEPLPSWTPYQLRYTRLREIRKRGGQEAAQATAGHSRATMTDHYAPANWGRAAQFAAKHG